MPEVIQIHPFPDVAITREDIAEAFKTVLKRKLEPMAVHIGVKQYNLFKERSLDTSEWRQGFLKEWFTEDGLVPEAKIFGADFKYHPDVPDMFEIWSSKDKPTTLLG